MNIPCYSIFRYNLLKGIVVGNILVILFGTVNPQFGFRFALLYWLVMSPYILYLHGKEKAALTKKYGLRRGKGIALRLLFTRYFIGLLALLGATIETYFGGNVLLLLIAGTMWSIVYSKIQAETECLKSADAIEEKKSLHST